MKTLRRILLAVAAAAVTCLMAGSCGVSKIKDIKLVSAGVDEVPFATFTAGEMRVEGKQIIRYELPCSIALEPGISLLDVLKLSTRRSLDGIKADVNLNVASKNGTLKAPLSYKNLDLAEFSK